jgi:hypothetical protein
MAKCRNCANWGIDVAARRRVNATWLLCDIPPPVFDVPVREWVFDVDRGRLRWATTGDIVRGAGGGKKIQAHAEHSCVHFVGIDRKRH